MEYQFGRSGGVVNHQRSRDTQQQQQQQQQQQPQQQPQQRQPQQNQSQTQDTIETSNRFDVLAEVESMDN